MKIKVDKKLISHLENLAKLELTDEERKKTHGRTGKDPKLYVDSR